MNRFYNFLIPGFAAARAQNPLLTSLGARRRARERRMDWLLALGLVVWVGVCMAGQWLPFQFFQTTTMNSSWLLMFLIRYPLEFIVDVVELLGLFVALLIMLRGALVPAQVDDWAAAPITSRDVFHYVWGRVVGVLFKVSLIAIVPLALYWIAVGRIFQGIGNWQWVLYWCVMLPVSLFIRLARFYLMMMVMSAILTRRQLAVDAFAECGFTAAGILLCFVIFDGIISGLMSMMWVVPSIRTIMANYIVLWILLNSAAPFLLAVVMILWGRRIARASAGRFWEWWLDGPRAWRWRWLKGVLLPR